MISSPDKLEYSDKPSFRNPFHVKELYREEFQALLSTHCRNMRMIGQRVVFGSVLVGEPPSQGIRFQRHEREPAPTPADLQPMHWVAMISDDPLPAASDSIHEQPAAAISGIVDHQRNSNIARVIRLTAASNSKHLKSRLRSDWYLQQHRDVAAAGSDPNEHWIASGAEEGRPPSSAPFSLLDDLLQERELLAQQDARRQSQERLERAEKERFEQRASLQAEVARVQRETGEKIESQLRELAEREKTLTAQIVQQHAGFNAERATLGGAAEQKLAVLAAEYANRERQLRQDLQDLHERLGETQREAREQVESQLRHLVEPEQAFSGQLLREQGHFNAQFATLAAEFGNRELQWGQKLRSFQERPELMVAEDRTLLWSQYSSILTDPKRDLEVLQTSMSWRLAAPFRAVAAVFGSKARLPQLGEIDSLMHLPPSRDDTAAVKEQTIRVSRRHGQWNA